METNNYIVSARKYRPMTFDTVVGQSALTTTLMRSIQTGHLAHAYLFCGPRGVGKTTCARIFAKTINCLNPKADGEACGECESCRAFKEGRSLSIYELDAASNNGVEEIKKLIEQTRIPPQVGHYKVFIIDEVHMLSNAAFNAFLKTLEEPHWILCSETVDLPYREVLCCDRYGEELIGWLLYSDDQWLCKSDGATMYDPIAWCEKPESQRIPCSITTNLPDHEVLCCDLRGNMLIGYLYTDENSDTGFGAESDGECLVDCVAWRETPKPWYER